MRRRLSPARWRARARDSRSTTVARTRRSPSIGCSQRGRRSRSTASLTARSGRPRDRRQCRARGARLAGVGARVHDHRRGLPRRIGRRRARPASQSRRRASRCTTPGTAATWTRVGPAGCWSTTAFARPGCGTPRSRPGLCARSTTPSSCPIRMPAPSSMATPPRRPGLNIAVELATTASRRYGSSSTMAGRSLRSVPPRIWRLPTSRCRSETSRTT